MQMSKIYLLIDYGYNGYEIVSCNKSDFKKIQYFYNELNRLNYGWIYNGKITYIIYDFENKSDQDIKSFYSVFKNFKKSVGRKDFSLYQTHIHGKSQKEIQELKDLAGLRFNGE